MDMPFVNSIHSRNDDSMSPSANPSQEGCTTDLKTQELGAFLRSDIIRREFLSYYTQKGFVEIPGSSVIPVNDPTLLFINSGMAPLKPFFTGEKQPPASALCNIQTCIRTNDIDSIGDAYHLTMFEMMGNWTFGRLSKQEAISNAFELINRVFKLDGQRLCATYFGGDASLPCIPADIESRDVWSALGFKERDIYALGAADNFWGPAGNSGPCGPCTEMFIDRGPEFGHRADEAPDSGSGRFIEIWNPGVFMEWSLSEGGSLTQLAQKNLDAGAGVERWAMILQGAKCIYDIDSIAPIMAVVVEQGLASDSVSARVITDHLRTSTILAAEGVLPSNKREGYVMRRLIRRATSHAVLNNVGVDFFGDVVSTAMHTFNHKYGEDAERLRKAQEIISAEVKSFRDVLNKGSKMFEKMASRLNGTFPGEQAFKLKESYGLPTEVIEMLCANRGLTLDSEGFSRCSEAHRVVSRQ